MKMLFEGDYGDTPRNLLLGANYAEFRDPNTNKVSFVRRLGSGFYPRFHVYLKDHSRGFIVDLHLDQKKKAAFGKMHGGEYDGEVVKDELNRVMMMIIPKEVK